MKLKQKLNKYKDNAENCTLEDIFEMRDIKTKEAEDDI